MRLRVLVLCLALAAAGPSTVIFFPNGEVVDGAAVTLPDGHENMSVRAILQQVAPQCASLMPAGETKVLRPSVATPSYPKYFHSLAHSIELTILHYLFILTHNHLPSIHPPPFL